MSRCVMLPHLKRNSRHDQASCPHKPTPPVRRPSPQFYRLSSAAQQETPRQAHATVRASVCLSSPSCANTTGLNWRRCTSGQRHRTLTPQRIPNTESSHLVAVRVVAPALPINDATANTHALPDHGCCDRIATTNSKPISLGRCRRMPLPRGRWPIAGSGARPETLTRPPASTRHEGASRGRTATPVNTGSPR